jgi:hypothetical protein
LGGQGGGAGAPNDPPADPPVNGLVPCEPLNSGYAGDEICLLPPDPGTGHQIHIGPADYDDPAQVEPFLLYPDATASGDVTGHYRLITDNDETIQFYEQHYRMRPGSHHLFMSLLSELIAEADVGWVPGGGGLEGLLIGGTQRAIGDFPPSGETPPEDANLARPLPPRTSMSFELHYVNVTPDPLFREVWINLMKTESDAPEVLGGVFMIGGGFNIPPGDRQMLNYVSQPLTEQDGEKRIVSLFGHRHASTVRFTAWVHRNGQRELVYEDYEWSEPAELLYNSITDNGAPDPEALNPGGYSGVLSLRPGDAIEWECEVHNQQSVTLTFGNEVYTKEMCNLFGSTAGGPSPFLTSFNPTFTER